MAEEVAYRLPHPQKMEDCPKDQDLIPDPKPQFCDYVCPNLLSGALGVLCLPLTLLGGITQINAKQHAAVSIPCFELRRVQRGGTVHCARAMRKVGYFGPVFLDTAAVPQPLLLFAQIWR